MAKVTKKLDGAPDAPESAEAAVEPKAEKVAKRDPSMPKLDEHNKFLLSQFKKQAADKLIKLCKVCEWAIVDKKGDRGDPVVEDGKTVQVCGYAGDLHEAA